MADSNSRLIKKVKGKKETYIIILCRESEYEEAFLIPVI